MMLVSTIPQSAFAQQTPPATPQVLQEIANLKVRIEEEIASDFNATSRLNTTATGRIIVNNTENRTLTNVAVRLNSTTATSLDINNTITVAVLPPGESVVATYNVTTQPRLSLRHESKSITALETVEGWFREGKISATRKQAHSDPHSLIVGADNLLEFNVTVANAGAVNLTNVTVSDLVPNATVNATLLSGNATYDAESDAALIGLLAPGESALLTLRATLPAAAIGGPGTEFFDMRREIRASYSIAKEFTQEPAAGGVTPEQARQQEVLKLAIEMDDTQQRIQRSLDVSPVTDVITTLETEAWSLPSKLRREAFQRARDLGIPVNNSTFAAELEKQTRERTKEVLGRLPFLMSEFRKAHEAKIGDYARIAGSIHKQGKAFQRFLDELGLDINETVRRQAFERIATEGYSVEMQDLLRAQGFNTQIEEMRNFTARNVANLTALNLTQAHDQLSGAYVQAVRDSANTSLLVLRNSMFFNREANLTTPPHQPPGGAP